MDKRIEKLFAEYGKSFSALALTGYGAALCR